MMKEISVFVDEENTETHSGFDLEDVSENELLLVLMHMAYLLHNKGFDMEETFGDILEALENVEPLEDDDYYAKPKGLLH